MRTFVHCSFAVAAFLAATEALAAVPSNLEGRITVDGSSTVYPITEAVAEEFGKSARNVKVTVGISGTGGGFKKFCGNETDISNASRPIKSSEMDACAQNGVEYIELPVAYDALTVVVNPKNSWARTLTVSELKALWSPEAQGTITRWNQIRPSFPDQPIALFGAGVDSGTFDYFTEAIVGKSQSSRGDFTSSEDDNVLVQGVSGNQYALGFFGLAYYSENADKLAAVAIDDGNDANGKGAVLPGAETVRNGTYQPLSRPIFIYVRKSSLGRPEVQEFVKFYLDQATTLAREVGYVELVPEVVSLAKSRLSSQTVGTVFHGKGHAVGQSLTELYAKRSS
ncbi:MAG: PstS family phosphate ABC transporter substrate-binding protein [Bdellovibrionota bacterium]|nr:MAG: PstS family phosphate ABC transporter substrate-binding protein [Bdellovibrionota bacterium]